MVNTFEARYPGRCPACGESIKVGDPIADSEDGYVHDDCQQPEQPAKPPCTGCWMVHAGECL